MTNKQKRATNVSTFNNNVKKDTGKDVVEYLNSDLEQEEQDTTTTRPKSRQILSERKAVTFYIDSKWNDLLEEGRLEEKFKNKSVYLDHIFELYFKDKPFNK